MNPAGWDLEQLDLLGAVVAVLVFLSSTLVFAGRTWMGVSPGHWIGVPFLLMAVPLGFLLYTAPGAGRRPLYYVQIGLMLISILTLFVLDYVIGVDWRQTQWAVISMVVVYFGGTGGMIGVASHAGQPWTAMAAILFLVAAVMAFVQRAVTGL